MFSWISDWIAWQVHNVYDILQKADFVQGEWIYRFMACLKSFVGWHSQLYIYDPLYLVNMMLPISVPHHRLTFTFASWLSTPEGRERAWDSLPSKQAWRQDLAWL